MNGLTGFPGGAVGMFSSAFVVKPAKFSPAVLPNLKLWLRATDLNTITKDGSNFVSQWQDQSGNGNHFVSSGSSTPLYEASAINGLGGITFDGNDDYMATSSGGVLINTALPATIIMVFRNNGFPINQYPRFIMWKTEDSRGGSVGFSTDTSTYGPIQLSADTYKKFTLTAGFDTNAHKMNLAYSGAGYDPVGNWTITMGATTESGTQGVSPATWNLPQSYLGALYVGSLVQNAAITLSEVIVYQAISTGKEASDLSDYLLALWNV